VRLAAVFFALFLASGGSCWPSLSRSGRAEQATPGGRTRWPRNELITPVSSDRHQLLIASGIALAIMACASNRDRLAGGRAVPAATTHEHYGYQRDLLPPRSATSVCASPALTTSVKELADTFDDLLDRLERSFAFERQFVANASHEATHARSPECETSLDVAMAKPEPVPPHVRTLADRLRRELDHVDRLLESFLTLAHTQQGPLGDESTVSLGELARGAVERRADAISAMGLDVEQQQCPDAWVTGSETLLSRMVEKRDRQRRRPQPDRWVAPR